MFSPRILATFLFAWLLLSAVPAWAEGGGEGGAKKPSMACVGRCAGETSQCQAKCDEQYPEGDDSKLPDRMGCLGGCVDKYQACLEKCEK